MQGGGRRRTNVVHGELCGLVLKREEKRVGAAVQSAEVDCSRSGWVKERGREAKRQDGLFVFRILRWKWGSRAGTCIGGSV